MKASEVLKRYAEGRRDFRGENLRGLSFRGKDLSGADFSEADIRGTNFRDATLRGTQFTKAEAGLQKRWVVVLLMVCLVLVVFSGFFCALAGYLVADLLLNDNYGTESRIAGWALIISLLGLCLFIIRQGVNSAIAYAIAIAITIAYAIAIAYAYAFAFVIIYLTAFAFDSRTVVSSGLLAGIIASSITLILGLLSAYMSWRGIKGDEKYAFIGGNTVAIAAFGGTCFRDADLTDADFSAALLKNTNLKSEKLIRTCWRNAKKLDLARVGGTILFEAKVRELLVTGKGHRKSFVDFNFRGANLTDTDLSYANLKQADLSQAVLRGAILEGANLTETNCVGANFTAATLTAVCLEAWNIDSTTILEQVNCKLTPG